MGRWVKVAEATDIASGTGRRIVAGTHWLAVFNDAGEFFAIDDTCPHEGGSLSDGVLHEGRVICPLHAWVFDVRTGRCPRETHEPVLAYPTRRHEGAVEVELPD